MKRGVAHVVRPMGYLTCIAAPAVAVVDQFGYMIGEQEASWLDLIPCSGLVEGPGCFTCVLDLWVKSAL